MFYLEFNLTIDDFIFDILFIHNLFIPFMLCNRSLIFFVTLTSFIKNQIRNQINHSSFKHSLTLAHPPTNYS